MVDTRKRKRKDPSSDGKSSKKRARTPTPASPTAADAAEEIPFNDRKRPVEDELQCIQRKRKRKRKRETEGRAAQSEGNSSANGTGQLLSPKSRKEYLNKIGARREDGLPRGDVDRPHPSKGGSTGYPVSLRKLMITLYKSGGSVPKKMRRSIQRWIKDGVDPKKQTGNAPSEYPSGEHLFLIAFFKIVWPQATRPQCATFVALYSSDGRVLTDTEVTTAYEKLSLTRKKASTTAYQAFTEKNIYLHHCYWNLNFPAGIKDVPMERLMDGDEMAFHLGDVSLSYGHAVKGLRVRKAGHYSRGAQKIVVIMFVEPGDPSLPADTMGSKENPRIWYKISRDSGTTVEAYQTFLEDDVMDYFNDDEPQRTLLHDNLSAHKADEIYAAVYRRGHRVICRPPYRPYEAPIEWVFNQLACSVRSKWEKIKNEDDLVDEITRIINDRDGLGGFYDLFKACGYKATKGKVSAELSDEGYESDCEDASIESGVDLSTLMTNQLLFDDKFTYVADDCDSDDTMGMDE